MDSDSESARLPRRSTRPQASRSDSSWAAERGPLPEPLRATLGQTLGRDTVTCSRTQ